MIKYKGHGSGEISSWQCNVKKYQGEFRKVSHLSLFHMWGFNVITGVVILFNCLKYHFY